MDTQSAKMVTAAISAVLLAFALVGLSYYLFPAPQNLPPPFPLPPQAGTTYYVGSPSPLPGISISPDGNVNSTTAPIKRAEETYSLTGDIINFTLEIKRDNIIVDGAGHNLQGFSNGSEYAYQAVLIQDRNNVTITNLKITQFWQAIFIQNSTNITINANNLTRIGSTGIYINSANKTAIKQNTIDDVATAIYVTNLSGFGESSNTEILENNITNAATGIDISPGSFNVISENNFAYVHNVIGEVGNSTVISKNNMINGIEGISIGGTVQTENNLSIGGSDCSIFGNLVENFSGTGIGILGAENNVYDNIVKNANTGVWLEANNWTQAKNNMFFENDFINNSQNVRVDAPNQTNYWDNEKAGNYWSDYKGTDNNNDGIGDTPYIINVNNIDNYPLITPYKSNTPFLSSQMYALLLGAGLTTAVAITVGTMIFTKRAKPRKRKQH